MSENKKKIFFLIAALISASAVSFTLQLRTSNMITAILALIFAYVYNRQWDISDKVPDRKRIAIASIVIALILTCFMSMYMIEYQDDFYELTGVGKLAVLLCVAGGYFFLFLTLLKWLYSKMTEVILTNAEPYKKAPRIVFIGTAILILLCWLPFYLKNFPAVIISDSMDQLGQAVSGVYSNHHPVAQTWILQFFVNIGLQMTGQMKTGIAAFCVVQMIVLAMIYSYVITECYTHRVKKWICICMFLFYAIMPYNVMYAINIWKDSLFSGGLLLFIVLLWKLLRQEQQAVYVIVAEEILLVLSGCVVTLFRNNGFYAFLAVVPFVCVLCWRRSRHTVFAMAAVLLLTVLIRGPVFTQFQVASPDIIESLSIPAQQIARVITNGGELKEDEQLLLEQVVDVSRIPSVYNEGVSDPVKDLVRESGSQEYLRLHKSEYLKLWISLGMRYPMHYIRAFLHQTEGYWYPDVQRWVYTEGVCENSGGIITEPKLPETITDLLGKGFLWQGYTKIPVYGLFWSIGAAVWMTFIAAGLCFVVNKKKELILFLPMLALWSTLLAATPVNGEFRYLYSIFICLPFYMIVSKIDI